MGVCLAHLGYRMKVDLLEASQAELLGEDAEQRLSRFIIPFALTEYNNVVDLQSATVRVPCLWQMKLISAFSYKVIVQNQFHLDVLVSVFPGGSTDQAGNLTGCFVCVRFH